MGNCLAIASKTEQEVIQSLKRTFVTVDCESNLLHGMTEGKWSFGCNVCTGAKWPLQSSIYHRPRIFFSTRPNVSSTFLSRENGGSYTQTFLIWCSTFKSRGRIQSMKTDLIILSAENERTKEKRLPYYLFTYF